MRGGSTATSWHRALHPLTRLARGLVAAGLLTTGVAAIGVVPATGDPEPGIRQVGTLKFSPEDQSASIQPNGRLVLDSATRHGFRIYDKAGATQVSAFDLDSFADGPSVELPTESFRTQAGIVSPPVAFGGGRLYIADTGGWVTAIDEASLQVVNQFPGPLPNQSFGHDESKRLSADGQRTPSGSDPVRLGAIAYWPATAKLSRAKLLVLTDTTISDVERPNIVQLAQWDAETGHEDWATSLSACRSGRGSQQSKYGLGLAVSTPPYQPDVAAQCRRFRDSDKWAATAVGRFLERWHK